MQLIAFLFALTFAFAANAFPMGGGESGAAPLILGGAQYTEAAGYTNQLKTCHDEETCPTAVSGEHRKLMAVAKYNCKNPRFVFCNWWIRPGDEAVGPNQFDVEMGYEPNGGTTSALLFGGNNSYTTQPGSCAVSDVGRPTIYSDTPFYHRMVVVVPDATGSYYGGNSVSSKYSARTLVNTQVYESGALVSPYAGISSTSVGGYGSMPIEVLCEMKDGAISFSVIGDSIENGLSAAAKGMALANVPFANYSRNYMTLNSTIGQYRLSMIQYHTHVAVALGANNLGFTSRTNMETYYRNNWAEIKARGAKAGVADILPRTKTCTDENQEPYNAGYVDGGDRDYFNLTFFPAEVVAGRLDFIIRRSAKVEDPEDHNKWNTSGDLYSTDCTHLTNAGEDAAAIAYQEYIETVPQAAGDVN